MVCRARPIGEVTVAGPGAGPELAGLGVYSDVIAVARSRARAHQNAGVGTGSSPSSIRRRAT